MSKIPIVELNDKDFGNKFNFEIWSTQGSSDYRNDRERPYNGQDHTFHGKRGKTIIKGLTMRDVADCIVQGFLAASCKPELQNKANEINKNMQNTEHAAKGNWRYQDVYEIECDIDPIAVIQNTICFIEHYMGIFPNISNEDIKDTMNQLFGEEKL